MQLLLLEIQGKTVFSFPNFYCFNLTLHARHGGFQHGLPVTIIINNECIQINIIQEKSSVSLLEYINNLDKSYLHLGYQIHSIQNHIAHCFAYTKWIRKFHCQLLTVDKNVNFCFSMVLFCVVILLEVFSKCHLMFTNVYSRANSPQSFPFHSNPFESPKTNQFSEV